MLHLHYGRIFSELSAVDNDIGDAVQVLLYKMYKISLKHLFILQYY